MWWGGEWYRKQVCEKVGVTALYLYVPSSTFFTQEEKCTWNEVIYTYLLIFPFPSISSDFPHIDARFSPCSICHLLEWQIKSNIWIGKNLPLFTPSCFHKNILLLKLNFRESIQRVIFISPDKVNLLNTLAIVGCRQNALIYMYSQVWRVIWVFFHTLHR